MSIKDKYLELRKKVDSGIKELNQFEYFNNINAFKLHYINYYKGTNGGVSVQYKSDVYRNKLPMNLKEVSDVMSYILNYMEKASGINKVSYEGIKLSDFITNSYEEFGFEVVPSKKDRINAVHLFIVDGDKKAFKKSSYNPDYFDWYNPFVKTEDIEEIFKKYGSDFSLKKEHRLELKK